MALVHDEYGHFEGVVTNADILEAIVGEFRTDEGPVEPDAVQRDDGSWLIAGSMPVDEMADRLSMALPPERKYHTAAGFVLNQLGHLPAIGETFDHQGWRFEVVDLDGRRIDNISGLAHCHWATACKRLDVSYGDKIGHAKQACSKRSSHGR